MTGAASRASHARPAAPPPAPRTTSGTPAAPDTNTARANAIRTDRHRHSVAAWHDAPTTRAGDVVCAIQRTGLEFPFVGARRGRWRVRALGALAQGGPASPWRTFTYTK